MRTISNASIWAVLLAWCPIVVSEYCIVRVALCAMFASLMAMFARESKLEREDKLMAVLVGIAAISSALSQSPTNSLFGSWNSYDHGLLMMIVWWVVYRFSEASMSHVVMAGAAVAVTGLAQLLPNWWPPVLPWIGRATGIIGSPVHLGSLLAVCLPLSVFLARSDRRWHIASAILTVGLVATLSRGAMLAAGVGCAIVLIRTGSAGRSLKFALSAMLAVLVVACFIRSAKDSDTARIEAWRVAAKEAIANPFFGVGPDSLGPSYRKHMSKDFKQESRGRTAHENAHNIILQVAGTMGIPAAMLFVSLVCMIAYKNRLYPGVLGAIAAATVCSMFNPMKVPVIFAIASIARPPTLSRKPLFDDRPFFATACVLIFLAFSAKVYADFQAKAGEFLVRSGRPVAGMMAIDRAVRISPEVGRYAVMYANCAADLAAMDPRQKAREAIAFKMVEMAARRVRNHGDSEGHYILAFCARTAWKITGVERYRALAENQARIGVEMAPGFDPVSDLLDGLAPKSNKNAIFRKEGRIH